MPTKHSNERSNSTAPKGLYIIFPRDTPEAKKLISLLQNYGCKDKNPYLFLPKGLLQNSNFLEDLASKNLIALFEHVVVTQFQQRATEEDKRQASSDFVNKLETFFKLPEPPEAEKDETQVTPKKG